MPHGVHTAAQISLTQADSIASKLALGVGQLATAAQLGCSVHTVRAVQANQPERVESWKSTTFKYLSIFAENTAKSLADNPEQISPNAKPIALAVAIDKLLLLSGEATSRIEHVSSEVFETRDEIAQLPEAQVIDCETTKTEPVKD